MLNFLKELFQREAVPDTAQPKPDVEQLIQKIREKEQASVIEPGRKIHEFDHGDFALRLDRDITKQYRITVFMGNERIYSFTVFEDQDLEKAYHHIIDFLNGSRSLKELPDTELLKGFYYGHS